MLKQKNKHEYSIFGRRVKYVALVLLISVFASTCLLPVSEANATVKGKIIKIKGVGGKTTTSATKGAAKTGLLSGITSLAGTALIGVGIVAFVVVLLGITTSFVKAAITMDASYYNLNNAFINTGWRMVRDICNLFFLLVLLFIAFCTILQIEKYNAKKNLLTLILMALLINFSKPIAIFIFDGSQLMMQWFLRDGADITSAIGLASHVGNLFSDFVKGGQDLVAGILVGIVFTFIYIVVLFCLGLFLFIRLVAIWLLVIVSPVAFFAMILPDFRKLSSQWWDALFRYSYVGPAIAFFLWLSTSLKAQIGRMKNMNPEVGGDIGSAFLNTQFFVPYIITIIFLFAALMMANQFGIHFSQAITKGANRFMGWAVITALKWGERSFLMEPKIFGKKLPFSLSPRAWIKGWREHSAEVDRRALEQAMAQPRDFLSSVFRRGERPKTYFRDVMFSKLEAEKMKELESVTTESSYMIDTIERAKKVKTREAQAAAVAALKILAKNNDWDDYMIDGKGLAHDPLKAKQEMLNDLKTAGLSEQEVGKIFYQLGNIALPNGNMGYWGMSTYDRDTGQYKITDKATQLAKIRAKAQTFETQGLAKVLHRNAIMEEAADQYYIDKNGKRKYNKRVFSRVHEVGQVMAEILGENLSALEQFKGRGKVDTLLASGGPKSVPIWENMARESLNAYKRLASAIPKLTQALERAQAAGRTDQVQKISAKMEEINNLYGNAQIYLNFGATAHQAYTKGKDSKAIQLNEKEFDDFQNGARLDDIVKEVLARLEKEDAEKKKKGKEPEKTEGGSFDPDD